MSLSEKEPITNKEWDYQRLQLTPEEKKRAKAEMILLNRQLTQLVGDSFIR